MTVKVCKKKFDSCVDVVSSVLGWIVVAGSFLLIPVGIVLAIFDFRFALLSISFVVVGVIMTFFAVPFSRLFDLDEDVSYFACTFFGDLNRCFHLFEWDEDC